MARYLAGEHHPQQALPPRAMWVAEDGDSPVGYIAGHLTRRFGCDGELLRLLAAWFVERSAPRVCVDVGDEHAGRFYKRHGAEDLTKHWLAWNDIGIVLGRSAAQDRGESIES